jgi:phage terminase large subunit-like protein
MRQKLEEEIARFNIFQRSVLGAKEKIKTNPETDIRNYAKFILLEGEMDEKRFVEEVRALTGIVTRAASSGLEIELLSKPF